MTDEHELPGCGTPQAYRRHVTERRKQRDRGEQQTPIDRACQDAWAKWMRQRQARLTAKREPRLSESDAELIRALRSDGAHVQEIADRFGVSRAHVSLVCRSEPV